MESRSWHEPVEVECATCGAKYTAYREVVEWYPDEGGVLGPEKGPPSGLCHQCGSHEKVGWP